MHSCWRLSSCLLLQALLFGQAPEVLASPLWGPAAFDPVRGRVVRALSDRTTWEWDGAWFRSLATAPDIGSSGCDMVFDGVRQRVVLCVRWASSMFAYDGAQWTPLPLPPGQLPLHLVYDVGRARLVLLTLGSTQALTSTFEDSGAGWVAVNTATRVSAALLWPQDAATYDPLTGRTMFMTSGGSSGSAALWWYDGVNWSLQSSGAPALQQGSALAFDPARRVVVMHGGVVGFAQLLADVWEWNGTTWTNRGPGTGAVLRPPTCSLTFDSARGRLLGLGWGDPYVAQWDGAAWTVLDRPVQGPSRIVHDPLRNVTVGVSTTQTLEWRDGLWALGTRQQPPIETAFFDIVRGAVVGVSLAQQPGFWLWSGSTWNALPPSAAVPPARLNYALAFDPLRGRATLFGGVAGGVDLGDTWLWSGATWTLAQPPTSPPPRYGASIVHDIARSRAVLAGGAAGPLPTVTWFGDTWSFDGTTWQLLSASSPWLAQPQFNRVSDLVYDDVAQQTLGVTVFNGRFEKYLLGAAGWQLLSSDPATITSIASTAFELARGTILIQGNNLSRVPVHASVVASSGAGCGRPLQLSARTWPRQGERAFGFDLQGVLGAAVVAVSTGTANAPLGGGCTALLPSVELALLAVPNAAGFGEALVPIPDLPFFRGLAVYAQAAQLDPTSPIGVGLSARLDLIVGD